MTRQKDHLAGITAALTSKGIGTAPKENEQRPRGSGATSGPLELARFSSGYQDLQAKVGKAMRVRMDLCDDGPYHATPIERERVEDLKANLATNPQSTPASVRVKPDGRFEIIAGRHRKIALTELGEEEWDIVIRDFNDDEAERATFYDNLLAPQFTDYARFRGFEARKERTGLSLEKLAEEAGKSKAFVVRLMAFQKLPQVALSAVERAPRNFGYNMVAKLAALVDAHPAEVQQVVELVAGGSLTQEAAPSKVLELAAGRREKEVAAPREGRHTVSWEGKDYATVDLRGKKLTINLTSKDDAEAAQKAVLKALEERAKKAR